MRTLMLAVAAAALAQPVRAAEWQSHPGIGRIVVHVHRTGLLSAFAHDHHFEATRWRASASIPKDDGASADVVLEIEADSLRDRQPSLSEENLRKVNAQVAGPDVLDAERHPRIEFRSERFQVEDGSGAERVRGTLHGTVTIRGRSAPTEIAIDAQRLASEWRVRGSARLRQTSFGIEPFSGFAGTVEVKDEVDVELAIILRPRG